VTAELVLFENGQIIYKLNSVTCVLSLLAMSFKQTVHKKKKVREAMFLVMPDGLART